MNRKSTQFGTMIAVGILFLSGGMTNLCAFEKATFSTQLDLFLPGNAGDDPEDFAKANAESLVTSGYSASSFESDVHSGVGARVGLMAPVRGFELGGSLGYVLAPKVDTTVHADSAILGNAGIEREKTTQYVRLLGEARKKWALNDAWSLNLGAGLGVAQGHTKDKVTTGGSAPATGGGSESDFGFTWEVSPSVSFKRFDLGVRYAGFPKIDGSTTVSDFKWSTFGFFLGASF